MAAVARSESALFKRLEGIVEEAKERTRREGGLDATYELRLALHVFERATTLSSFEAGVLMGVSGYSPDMIEALAQKTQQGVWARFADVYSWEAPF